MRKKRASIKHSKHILQQNFHGEIKGDVIGRDKVSQQQTRMRKPRVTPVKPESVVQKEFINNAGISCGPEERMKLEALAKKSEFRLLRKLRELGTLKYHDGSGQLRVEITVPVIAVALLFAFLIGLCSYAVWLSIKEELWGRESWQRVAWGGGFSLAAATFTYFAYVVFYPLAHIPKIKKLLSK